jgi:hypothetical protein
MSSTSETWNVTIHVTVLWVCSEKGTKVVENMEPTIGLEPMTCRLRKDPTLRMLL